MSQRSTALAKNTAIFALGNFGSKILQVVLVPYYTRVLSDSQFGTADILQSVVSLLFPIISLSVYEAVFRYAMDKGEDKQAIFSAGLAITLAGSASLLVVGVLVQISLQPKFLTVIVLSTVFHALRSLYSQYTKAIDKTLLFTVDNILLTVFVLVLNIFFISVLKLGVFGYMLGYTLANAFSVLFLKIALKEHSKFKFSLIKFSVLKKLLKFSSPLILNTVCWWLASFTSRYVIVFFIGTAANGIYTAANKIPSLLSVLVSVFFSAWQISANNEFKARDAAEFYTKIYNQIYAAVITLSSFLILFCKLITRLFLGADFRSSWSLMPTLLIAMSFFAFAQFLGSVYCANEKTGMAFVTNLICVFVCLFFNFTLIKPLGIFGCAVATAISYFVLWIIRILNTAKIIKIKHNILKIGLSLLILITQNILISFQVKFAYPVSAVGFICLLFIFKNTFKELLNFTVKLWKTALLRKPMQ